MENEWEAVALTVKISLSASVLSVSDLAVPPVHGLYQYVRNPMTAQIQSEIILTQFVPAVANGQVVFGVQRCFPYCLEGNS